MKTKLQTELKVLQEMFGSETPTLCIAIHVGE